MSNHEFLYEVGDEFEGSASDASRFISEVKRVGGSVQIIGKRVVITDLPAHLKKSKPAPKPKPTPKVEEPKVEVEEVVEQAPEPVVEEVAEVAEEAAEIEEEVKPKRRSRKFSSGE